MIHSYTSLAEWRLCPRLHKARFIDRSVKFVETPEMQEGIRVHKVMEDFMGGAAEVPPDYKGNVPFLHLLREHGGRPEVPLGMTRDGRGCEFFDKAHVWLRGKVDVYLPIRERAAAIMVDWKTGNPRYTDELQAQVYGALLYACTKLIERTLFVWSYVKKGVEKPLVVDNQHAFEEVRRLVDRIEADTEHPPRPGWKCRYCPLTTCEYNQTEG